MHPEIQYLNTLEEIITKGEKVSNRTGVDTFRILGIMHKYNFEDGFPLLTTKKVYWKGVVHELLWFLRGDTNIKYLIDNDVNIWNDDAWNYHQKVYQGPIVTTKEGWLKTIKERHHNGNGRGLWGDLGPIYGAQWRRWRDQMGYPVDQLTNLVHNIKTDPTSRRHILSAWNAADIYQMSVPPCHLLSQYTVTNDGKLWCHMYQRSADFFLGVPFNIASYALLTHMLAQVTGLKPGGFIHTIHDGHCYENHIPAAREQLTRQPKPFPRIELNPNIKHIDDFRFEDINLINYDSHPTIKAPLNT